MSDAIASTLAVIGASLVMLAGIGVLRFRDVYARMHAATKASTLGIALVGLAGCTVLDGRPKLVLTVVFIFVTAPSAAHLIGRAAHRAEGVDILLDGGDELAEMLDEALDGDEG